MQHDDKDHDDDDIFKSQQIKYLLYPKIEANVS